MTMSFDDKQLQATRDAMEDLRTRLAYMRPDQLVRVEEMVCHAINELASTPCHESCNLCR